MDAQLAKLAASKKTNEQATHQMEAQKPLITFEDFSKNDIRVGTIIAAERVPKTKNLLKMTIDTGIGYLNNYKVQLLPGAAFLDYTGISNGGASDPSSVPPRATKAASAAEQLAALEGGGS